MKTTTLETPVRPTARRVVAALGVALTLAGCDAARGAPASPVSHAVPEAMPAAGMASGTGPRALCAAAPAGATSLDVALRDQVRRSAQAPESIEPWLALGGIWVQKARATSDPGFYVNANACADAVLALSPGNRLAEDLRGFSYLNDHRFRDARELATAVLAREPDDATAWGTLSDAELELGNVAGAEHAAQRMLDLKPSLASYGRAAYLRWLRGDVASAKRLGGSAIRAGREAKDREPLAWAIVQAALVFWHEGDYDGARAGFDLALGESPGYAPALVGKARVALASGRYAEAATDLEHAFATAPLVETAWLLGDAKRLAGDTAGAEVAYATVVTRGRLHDPRTLSLFLSAHHRGAAEAVSLARAELARRPGPYTSDALAWALYRAGELVEARRLADPIVELGVHDARLLFHAGAIRMASGDASGKKLVERALSLNPAFDVVEAEEARRLVPHDA